MRTDRSTATKHRSGTARRSGTTARIVGALLMVWGTIIAVAAPASAGVQFGAGPDFVSPVVVGQTGLPASFQISNTSFGADAMGNVQLSTITMIPSCSNSNSGCAGGIADPDAFALSATGTGEAGTVCAGETFTITEINPATGEVSFTPIGGPVVLGPPGSPTSTCRINFTFSVLKTPAADSDPGQPGVQTIQVGFAQGTNTTTGITGFGGGGSQTTVFPASPTLVTQVVDPGVTIGDPIQDTATLAGGAGPGGPTGTITFTVFGPGDPTCATPLLPPLAPVPVAGNGVYNSPPFTPTVAGTYQFIATYSGDINNDPATTACNDPAELVVVALAQPDIVTTASAPVSIGGQITDTATLSGGSTAPPIGGTITFNLYGPGDTTCAGPPIFTSNVVVNGNGDYTSDPYTVVDPPGAGLYRFIALYNGDPNNDPAATACNDAGEDVLIPANPDIVTEVDDATVTVGGTMQDTATITGGQAPIGGTVTFNVYGPDDATCAGPVFFTETVPVVTPGPGGPTTATATTSAIPVNVVGTFRFIALYSGDGGNNNPAATACNDPNETVVVSPAQPDIVTAVTSPSVTVGGTIQDRAVITGGVGILTGTVTFNVYGPDDPTCAGPVFDTQTVPVISPGPGGPGTARANTSAIPVTAVGLYRFTASYSGDIPPGANAPAGPTACGAPDEEVTVVQANPTIVTTASASVPVGGQIFDTATLSGGVNPTGFIVFRLYGPDNDTCTGTPAQVQSVPVNGNGAYQSPPFTTTAAGTYRFVAVYNGDANNAAAGPTACLDPAEDVVVTPLTPQLTTLASAPVAAGGQIHDTATLSGGFNPTGTITFTVYGPANPADPPTCITPTVFGPGSPNPVSVAVNGNGNYDSPDFTVNGAGIYRFIASYSGDANNAPAGPTLCDDPAEAVLVTPQVTQLTTNASASVPVGGQISDTATLSGGTLPTGTITFTLFGPDNATCTGAPIFTDTVTVNGNGAYPSDPFTTVLAGTYRWIAVYSGDANNEPAVTDCDDPAEQVVVTQIPTGLTTVASPSVPLGGAVSDTATLTGGTSPTGTITFDLFGPDNPTCTGVPVFTSTVAVTGAGDYQSGPFTPVLPGVYRFQARYSGDANNLPQGPTVCTDPLEDVLVTAIPSLTTQASASVPEGGVIFDTATLTGGITPTGTITFNLFGPDNATCTGVPIFTSTVTVAGNGSYQSGNFTTQVNGPAGPGVYRWVATYSGDANNEPVGPTACNDPAEQVVVTNIPPDIDIVKTADPLTRPEPGGSFTFSLVVTNPSPEPVTITSLVDNVYGDLNGRGTCAIGSVLAPSGGTYTCSFPGDFTGVGGQSQTDTVVVTGIDNEGATVTADDDAVVTLTTVPPTIAVVKTASPPSLPEPGGTFTFTVVVTNTSIKVLTLTALTDDVYGNLNGRGTCATGATLAANGGTYTCTFPGDFTGVGGQTQTDVVTATGVDAQGNSVSAEDDAVVAITSVAPSITVVKSVTPSSLPEPGGTFTFTATVNNTSQKVLTLTALVDDIYGNLNGQGTCSVPQTLPVGGSYTCTFPGTFTGLAPETQTDTVTGTAVDNQGNQVTAEDDAVVTLTPVTPTIAVVKTADPLTRPEPGGNFTFTVAVTNTTIKPLTITALTDDVYGDLNGQGTCAIGAVLAPGQTYTCSFTGPFTGVGGDSQTDVVSATGRDNQGNTVTATDDAVVSLTPVAPPTIAVTKTADPTSRPAPGGTFTFTVRVTNTSTRPLTITSLVDDIYGDLNGKGTCAVGAVLAPGETYTCSFPGEFRGNGGDQQTDTVTATGRDEQGREVTATARATVSLSPVPPPPVVPPPVVPPPPPIVQQPLPRTGFGLGGSARLAVALMVAGGLMVAATWRRASSRPAPALPSGISSSMAARRRSGANRSVSRLSSRLDRGGQPVWRGARPGRSRSGRLGRFRP